MNPHKALGRSSYNFTQIIACNDANPQRFRLPAISNLYNVVMRRLKTKILCFVQCRKDDFING